MPNATVYFATNRRLDNPDKPTDFGLDIVGDVGSLRFGKVEFRNVDLSPSGNEATLGGKGEIVIADEDMDDDDPKASLLGSDRIFEDVRAAMAAGKRDALFVVHGFDYTFRESAARVAQLAHWYGKGRDGKKMVPIMFAWPSKGDGPMTASYSDARHLSIASGPALARVLLKARDFLRAVPVSERCDQAVHLLAHSSGAFTLANGLQAMKPEVGAAVPPLFGEVVFAGGDVAHDALSRPDLLQPLLGACRRVTIYHNRWDQALWANAFDHTRADLGVVGPDETARGHPKVVSISVASVIDGDTDPQMHQYYRNNPRVRKDMLGTFSSLDADDSALHWRRYDDRKNQYIMAKIETAARGRRSRRRDHER